jgi:hypothetical protein
MRPASPKYDERSFFYTTPRLNPARSSLASPLPQPQPHAPQPSPWATPNLAPALQLHRAAPSAALTPGTASTSGASPLPAAARCERRPSFCKIRL